MYSVQWDQDNNKFASGSGDNTIKLWDARTGHCEMTMVGHANSVLAVQFDEQYKLVSGGYDKTVRVWDMRTGRCLRSLFGHSSAVFCLQFDYQKIISGSADKSMKLCDFEK